MKSQFLAIFQHKESCFQSLNESFGVKDDIEGIPAYIVKATPELIEIFKSPKTEDFEDWHFFVENPEAKEIHFVAIDECLFVREKGGQCDFGVFDAEYFVLVDIKDVKTKQRKANRKKAVEQLYNTLSILKESNVLPENLQKFAIVGLTFREYGNQAHPKARTSVASDSKRFQDAFQTDLLVVNGFCF